METNISHLLNELTLAEKIALLAGHDHWTTVPIERVGIPQMKVTDGPNGARGERTRGGTPSVCFPCGSALAATWNRELIESIGKALANEVKAKGAHILLAPTVNIHRTPLAGRNFECYSEDPYLTSQMALHYINGLQSEGVGACIKHFIANDQEFERNSISAEVDERTLHEIYLPPFKTAVMQAKPWAVMSSYNKLNGTYCSEHKPLLIDLLKEKWQFDGIVISDWFGSYSDKAAVGGLDLEMPGKARWLGQNLIEMVETGVLAEAIIDDKVRRLLYTMARAGLFENPERRPESGEDRASDRRLVRQAGGEAIVLLKNERALLPIDATTIQKIAVIGANAYWTQFQGGGSAHVTPHYAISPLAGIKAAVAQHTPPPAIIYHLGCPTHKRLPLIPTTYAPDGFMLEYFNNSEATGQPVQTRHTTSTQIAWFGDVPDGVIENFSLRMKGKFTAQASGPYTFSLAGVGESHLFINGEKELSNVVDPQTVTTPFEMWDNEQQVTVTLAAGETISLMALYNAPSNIVWRALRLGHLPPLPDDPIAEAVAAATEANIAIIIAGLNEEWESEGFDRIDMNLPRQQNELIHRVATANPNTIVVLNAGSPVHMPWLDNVKAVLQAWYLGQEQGNAIADVLFGTINPSGKLPTTFPKRYQDNPAYINYPGENGQVRYGEGLFVGYRYYDKKEIEPLFPFGHGLSYTTFTYSNLQIHPDGPDFKVQVDITNSGERDGAEIVQLYVHDVQSSLIRPMKELKGFAKVQLKAGDTQTVTLPLKRTDLAFYDPAFHAWRVEVGAFDLLIGRSATDIRLTGQLLVT